MKKTFMACFLLLQACSNNLSDNINPVKIPEAFSSLSLASSLGSVFSSELRMSGYNGDNGNLSLIQLNNPQTLWQKSIPGYDFSLVLGGANEIALVKANGISIFDDSNRLDFNFEANISQFDYSQTNNTFALTDRTGKNLQILRSLGEQKWQLDLFEIPWADEVPTVTDDDVFHRYLLSPSVSESGQKIVVTSLVDGRYAVYNAEKPASEIKNDPLNCPGLSGISWLEPQFLYAKLSSDGDHLYLGDKFGKIISVDMTESCSDLASSSTYKFNQDLPISAIHESDDGKILVAQAGGALALLEMGSAGFTTLSTLEAPCTFPIGLQAIGAEHVLVVCKNSFATTTAEDYDLATPFDLKRDYYAINLAESGVFESLQISEEVIAGSAIDITNHKLYYLSRSSLGILNYWDFFSNEKGQQTNMFIEGILDQ